MRFGPLAHAADRVRTPEDGAALLLAAVFYRAVRDLRTAQHGYAAACWLNSRAARDWAAAIDLNLPAVVTPAPRRAPKGDE